MLRTGFIGLGNQGAPIARRIAGGGFPLHLWARRPEALEAFAETGAAVCSSPAELGAACALVGVCVWDDAGVEDVLTGPAGLLAGAAPGTIVAVHSTVRPDTCVRLAAVAAEKGVVLIDAPVSGSSEAAVAGRLLVMVGGPEEAFLTSEPVFRSFGDPVVHMGPVGAGQIAKLVNNMLLAANIGLAYDAVQLGGRLGLDPGALATVLQHGSGRSFAMSIVARLIDHPEMAGLTRSYLSKDLALLQETAGEVTAGRDSVRVAAEAVALLDALRKAAT